MKQLILKTFLTSFGALAFFAPWQAEALKIKVQPSLSFFQSYGHVREEPVMVQPVQPVMVQEVYYTHPYPPQRVPVPVPGPVYNVYYPPQRVVYYPPMHYRTHSHSTNFGLTFKFR